MSRGTFALLRFFVGKLGLTVILVRSGLALNWHAIRPTLGRTSALAFLPFGVESVVSAAMALSRVVQPQLRTYNSNLPLWV